MEYLLEQTRVRFSRPDQGESNSTRERTRPPQQAESFKGDNMAQNWLQRKFSQQISQDYDIQGSEFAIAVAAAAFSIYSLEEAEAQHRQKMKEELERSRTKFKSQKGGTTTGMPSSGRVSREFSIKEVKSAGEQKQKGNSSSVTPLPPMAGEQRQKGNSSKRNDVETKADAWEKAQMTKINKQYEMTISAILAWEKEKKLQVKLEMERKKKELDERSARNQQHYQIKIARIDSTARGAKAQAVEKRENEESKVKNKAQKIGSTGKVPVRCFCF